MFQNLIESDAHTEELTRQSSFFLGVLAFYAVLLLLAGMVSIYAYDARLENQSLELTALLATPPSLPAHASENTGRPKGVEKSGDDKRVDIRRALIADTDRPDLVPEKTFTKGSEIPPLRSGMPAALGDFDFNARDYGGPVGPSRSSGMLNGTGGGASPAVKADVEPPPLTPEPTPPPKKTVYTREVLNGKAISLPKPPYPEIAKAIRVSGMVNVQVLLDESGRVVSARAISGHSLLQAAAVKAAYQARFTPTIFGGQPVKVSGVITYNFMLQ